MRAILLAVLTALVTGCTSFNTSIEPEAELSRVRHFWVERNLSDNRAVGLKIVRALQAQGRQAELGPLTMLSEEAEVIVTFRDSWTWDFGDHLTGLEVMVRDRRSRRLLARARFEGPLAFHLDEFEIVDRLVRKLLPPVDPAEAS